MYYFLLYRDNYIKNRTPLMDVTCSLGQVKESEQKILPCLLVLTLCQVASKPHYMVGLFSEYIIYVRPIWTARNGLGHFEGIFPFSPEVILVRYGLIAQTISYTSHWMFTDGWKPPKKCGEIIIQVLRCEKSPKKRDSSHSKFALQS